MILSIVPGARNGPEDGPPGPPRSKGGRQTGGAGGVLGQLHRVDPPYVQLERVVLHTVTRVAAETRL